MNELTENERKKITLFKGKARNNLLKKISLMNNWEGMKENYFIEREIKDNLLKRKDGE